jgi:3-isopropylmalate dehydrogenase
MLRVTVLPGDGVGREVLAASEGVLEALAGAEGFAYEWNEFACGGKHWLETGEEWPEGAYQACKDSDATLLGAVGWPGAKLPNGEVAGGGVLFGLRLGLDLYANVRPCRLYPGVPHKVNGGFRTIWDPDRVDMVLVRENTEGAYVPIKGYLDRSESRELAVDSRVITRRGALRIHRHAFRIAARRKAAGHPGRVTCVDKSNVMAGCRLFRECFEEVAAEFPDLETSAMYIDAFCHSLVREPEAFDVVVLPNLQGDVATDLAAALQGGMGMAASGNVGDDHAMFEPVHGSAPDIAGTGKANPVATIQCLGMMLEHLAGTRDEPAYQAAADRLDRAVARVLAAGEVLPADLGGEASCEAVAQAVAEAVTSDS